jgi:ankyrin repeat protein
VKLLVDHGADVRNTPAVHAAAADSVKFGGKAHPGRLEIMAFLLDRGADIDLLEPDTEIEGHPVTFHTGTALHRAVESEDPEHVRFLLRRGADRSIRGVTGMTPLEVAKMRHLHEIADILRNERA